MKILALLKGDERDLHIIRIVDQIATESDRVILLHAVQVNGEIPLQKTGEVLDFCSEFDLSPYHKESKRALGRMKEVIDNRNNFEAHSLVGDALKLVLSSVDRFEIDLVVSGAHVTTHLEDLMAKSFAGQLVKSLSIPYLTVNSEGDLGKITTIAVVDTDPIAMMATIVSDIQRRTGASLTSVQLKKEELEEGIKTLVAQGNIGLIALSSEHHAGLGDWLRKDSRVGLVNHIDFPILIF